MPNNIADYNSLTNYAFIIIVLIIINEIISNLKGKKTSFELIANSFNRIVKYTINETTGNVVQKINAFLAIVLFVANLIFLALIFISKLTNSDYKDFMICFIVCLVSLIITLPICERYTRHRY